MIIWFFTKGSQEKNLAVPFRARVKTVRFFKCVKVPMFVKA